MIMGIRSFFQSLFSSSSIIDNGMKMADNAFFTEQEKSAFLLDWLKATAPMAIARRFIAVIITFQWALMINVAIVLILIENDKIDKILALMRDNVESPFNIVLGLYFLSQVATRWNSSKEGKDNG